MWRSRAAAVAVLAALSSVLCFYGLGANGVHEVDEALHVRASLEMFEAGAWWSPTAFGEPYYNKPAFPLWLMAMSYRLLGPTVFAARLWPAAFAVAAVLATFTLGAVRSVGAGFVAGLMLATTYPFVYDHCARAADFDTVMLFSFVGSTILFVRALDTNRGWVACAALAALASHGKNFAGTAPALVFVIAIVLCRPRYRPTRKCAIVCGCVFIAVNLAWLAPMAALHGWPFLHQYVGEEVLKRPYWPKSFTVGGVFWTYAWQLLAGFFPWSIVAIIALLEDARKAIRHRDSLSVVTLCWIVVLGIVLCTVLRRGNQWYATPLFPFFAVSAARFLVGADARPTWSQQLRSGACLLAIAAAIGFQISPDANPFALWSLARPTALSRAGLPRALLLGVVALAGAIAGAGLSRGAGTATLRRRPQLAAVLVLSVAALLDVLRPLAMVDYRNAYERVRETLISARGANPAMLVVSMPAKYNNVVTRYYFGDLPGLRTEYLLNAPRAAVARARRAPGLTFCLLISELRQVHLRFASPDETIVSAEERRPFGAPTVYLSLLKIDSSALPRGDGVAAGSHEAR
ncbi:MAG: glycosyltransferase family 39 protein [Candidatus Binatia bacterium]|jgi:4-amino-4-deoxy-L-arabinose transferase-like glycosyltransferase